MRRHAANLLAAVHAVLELWVVWLIAVGPLHLATAALLVVALPMVALRGRCWLSMLEARMRGRRVSSMTRRLVWWATLGIWKPSVRAQWLILAALVAWWVGRIMGKALGF